MNATSPSAGNVIATATYGTPSRAPYEIRPLATAADRAAATALVEDRARQLAQRGITVPNHHVAAYRDPWAEAVGLFEVAADGEEQLAGCLLLHRQPQPRSRITDAGQHGLRISLAYTAPGRDDTIGTLLTLWVGDFAARTGAAAILSEAPARHTGTNQTLGRLFDHLTALGWLITGTGNTADGERVAWLKLPAENRSGLPAMIHCTLPLRAARPVLSGEPQ